MDYEALKSRKVSSGLHLRTPLAWNVCMQKEDMKCCHAFNLQLTKESVKESRLERGAMLSCDSIPGREAGRFYCYISLAACQRLVSRWKYQFSYDHSSQASWAQPVFRWVKLSEKWWVRLQSNLGVKLTWLLRETGNSAPDADLRIPPNKNKIIGCITTGIFICCFNSGRMKTLILGAKDIPADLFPNLEPQF